MPLDFLSKLIVPLIALMVLGTILSALFASLTARGGARDFPYVAADALLTPAERSFFGVLQQAISSEYHLLTKVRLADIIEVRRGLGGRRRQTAFNRICAKHADFVVCDPQTYRVVGVIELDDSSHRATKRRQRDEFLDSALAAASIPILHVPAQRSYAVAELRAQVQATFHPETLTPPPLPVPSATPA